MTYAGQSGKLEQRTLHSLPCPRICPIHNNMTATSNTVILGSGIIGLSTAYYLALSPSITGTSIHLIDSSPALFASASGRAAGFLAADWFVPALAPLGELSFALHRELADAHGGVERWGYSRSTGTSVVADEVGGGGASGVSGEDWLRQGGSRADVAGVHAFDAGDGPAWLTRQERHSVRVISEDSSTAQV